MWLLALYIAFLTLLLNSKLLDAAKASGAWGTWSDWSSCSRTCDAGVQSRIRACIRTSMTQKCAGNSKEFQSCPGLQTCPRNSPDYRWQQCSQFNSQPVHNIKYEWVPVDLTPNKCILNCQSKGYPLVQQRSAVVDGTRCADDSDDICVDGKCMPAGCDGILASTLKQDNCGICGGNGSCVVCDGTIRRPEMMMTYNKLLTIPHQATLIEVKEIVDTENSLALRQHGTHVYYLNGGNVKDPPGYYNISGTLFNYKYTGNDGYRGPEILKAPGPTTFTLDVMLQYVTLNHGIQYRYVLPVGRKCTLYAWHPRLTTTQCNATCGGGYYYRPIDCVNIHTGTVVPDKRCKHETKPSVMYGKCNKNPCPPRWVSGPWNACSVSCGQGTQTRDVACKLKFSHTFESTISDIMCSIQLLIPKPPTQRSCLPMPCLANWTTGQWSQCSAQCGWGTQNRRVHCGGNRKPSQCNPLTRPVGVRNCYRECEYIWYSSPWSDCSATCDSGIQTRIVFCYQTDGNRVLNHYCNYTARPARKQRCTSKTECGYDWFTGPWSTCSVSCGTGHQLRLVACMIKELDGQLEVYPNEYCKSHIPMPATSQQCTFGTCPEQWYSTEWSCCQGGQQNRSVFCSLGPTRLPSSQCDNAPLTQQQCSNTQCNERLGVRGYIPGIGREVSTLPSPAHESILNTVESTPNTVESTPWTKAIKRQETPTTSQPPTTEEPTPTTKGTGQECSNEKLWCRTLKINRGHKFLTEYCENEMILKNCCMSCQQ